MEKEIKVIKFTPIPNFTNKNIEKLILIREKQKQEKI